MANKHSGLQLVHLTLRVATFALFAGRAWQHLFWDAPFRALLWDKDIMESLVLFFRGGTWQEYVTSAATDQFIQYTVVGFGIFYALMAVLTLVVGSRQLAKFTPLYILSSLALVFLAFLYSKEKFFHVGQFFEYTIQFLLPLFFCYGLSNRIKKKKLLLLMKIAIAFTFTAHGLYAIGYYPQPGVFIDLFLNIFSIDEGTAKSILQIAGILDFIISITIFIPHLSAYSLIYAALWGGLTALARTLANFYIDFPLESLHQNLFETVYRLPHMLVPLAALFLTFYLNRSQLRPIRM
ncbi:hypothetical protein [Draconibacterium halophilum]|uniref:Uncharacterized protein n=1 Tax=Draconibacterium halophilum TaxID=2706887 RepID=A0A6C0R8H6_9BACT|nr:hypothetical protein [Draconibacterium halophilum]QIA06479.1 hypothetical protein G0Q07_01460 [Draconibacterium halophilum]